MRSLGLGGGPPYSSRLGGGHQGVGRGHPDTYKDFVEAEEAEEDGAGAGPWYVYECIPLLKNLAGFEQGSNKNSILTQFIKHMNQNAVGSVKEFISSDKSCSSGPGRILSSDWLMMLMLASDWLQGKRGVAIW